MFGTYTKTAGKVLQALARSKGDSRVGECVDGFGTWHLVLEVEFLSLSCEKGESRGILDKPKCLFSCYCFFFHKNLPDPFR